jgi:hypothetical protein
MKFCTKLGFDHAARVWRDRSQGLIVKFAPSRISISACFATVGVLVLTLGCPPSTQAWERTDVLDAIHQVENPNNTLRIGRRGELGPFQFRPSVWYTYTQKPFALAADSAEAQVVAEAHYEWIKRGLERNKLEVTPYHIGLVWNAGLQATVSNRASASSKHYAERISNLVEYKDPPKESSTAAELPKPPAS